MSDIEWMDQLYRALMEVRPNGTLNEAFSPSSPGPVLPLSDDVMVKFEHTQRDVREARPSDVIDRRRPIDQDEDDRDKEIRILLNYIHVSLHLECSRLKHLSLPRLVN